MKFLKFRVLHLTLVPTNLLLRIFLGHRGPTTTTSTYLSTNWRADIENDCQDFEQEAKTSPKCPKILFTKFLLRAPGRKEYYLPVNTIPSLQVMSAWQYPRRRRKALKFASASEFADFSLRERSPASIFHEIFEISDFAPDLDPRKSFSKNFSGTPRPNHNHQHISLDKLTGGYRKRLSGFWTGGQNVTNMPENSVHQIFASRPRHYNISWTVAT